MTRTFVIDIDGTICSDTAGEYESAVPYENKIAFINTLYDNGDTIIIFTARGMGRSGNDRNSAIVNWYEFTRLQLIGWGLKFHELHFGKPAGDFYVDDKNLTLDNFFAD
jgi:hypothetical protein